MIVLITHAKSPEHEKAPFLIMNHNWRGKNPRKSRVSIVEGFIDVSLAEWVTGTPHPEVLQPKGGAGGSRQHFGASSPTSSAAVSAAPAARGPNAAVTAVRAVTGETRAASAAEPATPAPFSSPVSQN